MNSLPIDQTAPRVRIRTRPIAPKVGGTDLPKLATVIEHVAIDLLIPYVGNARKHDQKQITKLVGAMRSFGVQVPLLVDEKNEIIAGHGRYLAAKQLDLTKVPVIRVDHLTQIRSKPFVSPTIA